MSAVQYSSYSKHLGNTQKKEQLLEKKLCLPNSDPGINRRKVRAKSSFLCYLLDGEFYHHETWWIAVMKCFKSLERYFVMG